MIGEFEVHADPNDPTRMRYSMRMNASDLGTMAAYLYEVEGMSHPQVTTWLEKNVPKFRECLIEVTFESGAVRWLTAPERIFMRLEIGDPVTR